MSTSALRWITAAWAMAFAVLWASSAIAGPAPGDDEPAPKVKTLTDDGGWGYAGPHAVTSNGMLFVSYLDRAGATWLAALGPGDEEFAKKKVWQGDADLHSANPLCVRPDGRLQVFVDEGGYVDKRLRWRTSAAPWDISEFGETRESALEADIIQGRQFYPMVAESTPEIHVIINALRDDGIRETVMWRSRDGGDTFPEYTRLWSLAEDLAGNRSYTRAYIHGDVIHMVIVRVGWNETVGEHAIGRVEGVYYIKYDINEEAFLRANGERAFTLDDAPVYDPERFDRIWCWQEDGGGEQRAVWSDIVTNSDGHPYVAFAVQDAAPQGESKTHDGYWATPDDGGAWRHHRVTELARGWDNTPERKNYAIAIDPDDPHTVFVAKSTDAEADLSQVHRMVSEDEGETWRSVETLSEEGRITTVVVPRRTDDTPRPVDVLWLEGHMEGWSDYATRILTHEPRTD